MTEDQNKGAPKDASGAAADPSPPPPAPAPPPPANQETGTPIGADDVTLLTRFREKFLPDTRIEASDACGKWLFGLTTTVAALGVGFSNSAFTKLTGHGIIAYGAAVLFAGLGLASATYALSVDLPDANWRSFDSMMEEVKAPLREKRYAIRLAAVLLALALAAAAAAPLLSVSREKPPVLEPAGLRYTLAGNSVDARLVAEGLKPGNQIALLLRATDDKNKISLLAAVEEVADKAGRVTLKIEKAAIPASTLSLTFAKVTQSNPEELLSNVVLKAAPDKVAAK